MGAADTKSNPDADNFFTKNDKKLLKDQKVVNSYDSLRFLQDDEGDDEMAQNKKNDEEFYKDYDRLPKKHT